MRLARALQLLFVLSLGLCLFGGELGESLRLADDVSNDLVQISPTHVVKSDEATFQDVYSQRGITAEAEFIQGLMLISFAQRTSFSISDLLSLTCIQRK
jgi:hypothetical protein